MVIKKMFQANTTIQMSIKYVQCIVVFIVSIFFFTACTKKIETQVPKNLKEQITTGKIDIPFATSKSESNAWYKKHFSTILKDSKNAIQAKPYENFAKLYFADLSQIAYKNKFINQSKLAQSVSFTLFSQELLREYLFIQDQKAIIASWSDFKSTIDFTPSIESANFVVRVSENIKAFENESYQYYNEVVLANSLVELTNKYNKQAQTSQKTQEITGLKHYHIPQDLASFLYYRILYIKYFEKFQTTFLLDKMVKNYPTEMLKATNNIFNTQNNLKNIQLQYNFQRFEPTNPVSIQQCKALSNNYPYSNRCIQEIFIPWLDYLHDNLRKIRQDSQLTLRQQNINPSIKNEKKQKSKKNSKKKNKKELQDSQTINISQENVKPNRALPIFVDSKLCLLLEYDRTILYPQNQSQSCQSLYYEWEKYRKTRKI
ncbi:hypothetical protein CQA53_02855 [Helicobacter didelphidarum]|uniref:Uncharacterized protein n=1 Tax=Helicobacter didelphidarum TaxID=2040648 RepID=A0A3D8IN76_9HELI|nr:hypothetical protein [Helicobacter didelphidarum]RDU66727.1 hypothetical protein CQA53_02855 [Helicobacter didelphidarum]